MILFHISYTGPSRHELSSDDVSCSTDVVQLFVVSHKDSLHLTQSNTAQNCELTSNIAVTFIDSPKLVPHDRSSLSSVGVHENQNNNKYRNTGCSSSNIGGDKNQDTNVSMRADGGTAIKRSSWSKTRYCRF